MPPVVEVCGPSRRGLCPQWVRFVVPVGEVSGPNGEVC